MSLGRSDGARVLCAPSRQPSSQTRVTSDSVRQPSLCIIDQPERNFGADVKQYEVKKARSGRLSASLRTAASVRQVQAGRSDRQQNVKNAVTNYHPTVTTWITLGDFMTVT